MGSGGAGGVATSCREVFELAVNDAVIEIVDREALEVTTDDLEDIDALPLTRPEKMFTATVPKDFTPSGLTTGVIVDGGIGAKIFY